MAIKEFYRKTTDVKSQLFASSGQVLSTAFLRCLSYERADAVFSRPMPFPKTETAMAIVKYLENPGVTRTTGVGRYYIGSYLGMFDSKSIRVDWTSDTTRAVQGALARYYQGDVNAAVLIGEAKSSLKMILKRFGQIRGLFGDVENLNFRGLYQRGIHIEKKKQSELRALPRNKRVANAYLEVKFGWLPLISDVYNLSDGIRSSLKTEGTEITGRFKSTSKDGLGRKTSATIRGRVTNTAVRSLAELGLSNPLLVAWELLPFSFVIDYFLGIGNTLAALPFSTGTTFITGSVTSSTGYIQYASHDGVTFVRSERIERTPITLTSAQQAAVSFGVKNELSISYTTAANLIALGLQRYR